MSEIDSVLKEKRLFKPAAAFSSQAHVKSFAAYEKIYRDSAKNPEKFWASQAKDLLQWSAPWKKVHEWKPPFAKWFLGGKINASVNCLDRHAATWRRNKAAIIWEGEPGEVRTFTYGQLLAETERFANVLKSRGIKKGDRIIVYMPMVPELPIAMLACARIGATHSVVFGGFSSQSLIDRITDAK